MPHFMLLTVLMPPMNVNQDIKMIYKHYVTEYKNKILCLYTEEKDKYIYCICIVCTVLTHDD